MALRQWTLAILSIAFSTACCVASPSSVVVERTFLPSRSYPPPGWSISSTPSPADPLTLHFALKHTNIPDMKRTFASVSDPSQREYGKHLSLQEVIDRFSPAQDNVETLLSWLEEQTRMERTQFTTTQGHEWISLTTSCKVASSMLGVEFVSYTNDESPNERLMRSRSPHYSLPREIRDIVAFVGGVTHFPKVTRVRVPLRDGVESPDALAVTPSVLHHIYNVSGVVGKSSENLQAVAQFLGQYYHSWDLQEFFALFWERNLGESVKKVIGSEGIFGGIEASLDIEYIMAMGSHIPTWFYSTGGTHKGQEPFLDWAMKVSNESIVPYVISISYGDDENSLSKEYTDRINEEFMKLGMRGVSLLFASGDSGVGGTYGRDGKCVQFSPSYPATSPYVTAVGGTALEGFSDYQVVNGLSGGGFSFYFDRPSYQEKAVESYLSSASNLPNASYWHRQGRGYPDISALSSGFTVVVDLIPLPGVAGTSCAAPTAAGIFSLLNDLRLQEGKSPLGFLNPFVYQTAASTDGAFFDVVKGSNPNCDTMGFPAQQGWDPSSGVGTPNYAELAKLM